MAFADHLIDTMTVYTEHVTTGQFTVVAASDVPCRLAQLPGQTAPMSPDRTEQSAFRRLLWGPSLIISERSQVAVDGRRYNLVAGTVAPARAAGGVLHHYGADAIEARDG